MVFVALGATASTLGQLLFERLSLLEKVAGVLLILFGLHTMGVLRISYFYKEARLETAQAGRPARRLRRSASPSPSDGRPCIGPILGSILALAAEEGTVAPRDAAARGLLARPGRSLPRDRRLRVDRFFAAFKKIRRHYQVIEIVAGCLMIIIGVLIFSDRFSIITRALTPYLPTF